MSGTLDQNAIRDAKLVTSTLRPDGEGEIKLFVTKSDNAPSTGPGFGYKTVKSKAQIYFYYDPARFPQGREDPQVASALQRLIDEMPRHPEKFSNCEPINSSANAGEEIANPDMASVEKRIETFKAWPRTDMNAHKLAAAGFFYAPIPGCADRCIFYASGNALFNWDANDDPWTEYKKWYPQCPHVRRRESSNGTAGSSAGAAAAHKTGSAVLSGIKSFFSSGAPAKTQTSSAVVTQAEGLTASWPAHIQDKDPATKWKKILEWELGRQAQERRAAGGDGGAGAGAHRRAEISAAATAAATQSLAEIEASISSARSQQSASPCSTPPASGAVASFDDDAKSSTSHASHGTEKSSLVDAVDSWNIKAEKEDWMREKAIFVAMRCRMGEELMMLEDKTKQRRAELAEVESHLKAAIDQFFQRNAAALDQVDERVEKLASGYARVAQLIARSMDTAILQKEAGLDALARRAQQHQEQRARAEEELKRIEDKRRQEEKELELMRTVFKAKRLDMVRMDVAADQRDA